MWVLLHLNYLFDQPQCIEVYTMLCLIHNQCRFINDLNPTIAVDVGVTPTDDDYNPAFLFILVATAGSLLCAL